jgi:hypothetical protein
VALAARTSPALRRGGDIEARQKKVREMQYPIYFSNIQMKHLQHMFETIETLATYVSNICKNT